MEGAVTAENSTRQRDIFTLGANARNMRMQRRQQPSIIYQFQNECAHARKIARTLSLARSRRVRRLFIAYIAEIGASSTLVPGRECMCKLRLRGSIIDVLPARRGWTRAYATWVTYRPSGLWPCCMRREKEEKGVREERETHA